MSAKSAEPSPALEDVWVAVERWLSREARLMDEHRFDEWFALWERDGIYWIPANEDDYDPTHHVSLLYKDWVLLRDRIERLKSGDSPAQETRSRLRRVVSNVELEIPEGADTAPGGEPLLRARANFLLAQRHLDVRHWFMGSSRYLLRVRPAGGFGIVEKRVLLLDNDAPLSNLVFLL